MCGVQLKDRQRSTDLMLIANSVRWYGHVLRRKDGHIMRMALDSEVEGQRKKITWKKQVGEESVKIGLRKKKALCRSKWSVGVNQIAAGLRCIWPPSLVENITRF